MSLPIDPVFTLAAGLMTGLVLCSGAVHKLRDPALFTAALRGYDLLPEAVVPTVAWGLMVSELVLGLGLCVPASAPLMAPAALGLLALVSGAVAINLMRGHVEIDCGCGGAGGDQPLSLGLLVRNLGLAGMVGITMWPSSPRALGLLDGFVLLVAVAGGVGLYAGVSQLIANAPRLRRLAEGRA